VGKFEVKDPEGRRLPDGSFFVLRSSDAHSAAAMYGYAHLLQTILEIDRGSSIYSEQERLLAEALAGRVVRLAEQWMKEQAVSAA
jgi:hypothetical protein